MRSKWLVTALVVSVGLNVAAIGIGIGFATGKPYWSRGVDPTAGLGPLIRSLPEHRREELAREGAPAISDGELRRRIGATIRDLRIAQRTIARTLAQEPFDPDAASAALATFREHMVANQASKPPGVRRNPRPAHARGTAPVPGNHAPRQGSSRPSWHPASTGRGTSVRPYRLVLR